MSLDDSTARPAGGAKSDFADDFAYTGDRIYLNSASVSVMPEPSIDAMRDFLIEYNSAGPDSAVSKELVTKKIQNVRSMISKIITCSPDEVVLTQSTTDGVNMVASGLGLGADAAGVIIRGMEHEHHANLYPWLRLAERGVRIRSLGIDRDGLFEMGQLASLLDGHAGLVVLSHALYNTGAILPVEEAGGVIRERADGCRFFLDAAQTIGCIDPADCDVSRIGCDYMSFNGSKWLCGPMGTGLFYCSREAGRTLDPIMIGGESATLDGHDACCSSGEGSNGRDSSSSSSSSSNDGSSNDTAPRRLALKDAPDRFQAGFRNYAGVAGLEASLEYVTGVGLGRIRAINRNLAGLLYDELSRMPGVAVYVPDDPARRTSIISFNIGGTSPGQVVERLARRGIILAVRSQGSLEHVRASPHFFNTEGEMHALLDALKRL
ncbi:MAG: aminotransferase class V-fold PLP-dependent enzyme [Thaumarchaeota archaeon]|nr:aminotransferase class V-fold PLP-dependent enzyme [Nitrososphaerota archaeon]